MEDQIDILKEISIEIFLIRKNRFLMSAPQDHIEKIQKLDLFKRVEQCLQNLSNTKDKEQCKINYDFFIQCSRSWESYCLDQNLKPRFVFQEESYIIHMIIYQTIHWLDAAKLEWQLLEIDDNQVIQKIQENMIKNIKVISKLVKLQINQEILRQFFQEIQIVKYKNKQMIVEWGFTSLSSNKIYIGDALNWIGYEKYIESLFVDCFSYWIIENKSPLIIISEYYKPKLKNGFVTELADIYLQNVYKIMIRYSSPFRMCMFEFPRRF
ncbi:hypothetical protein pb186bvf_005200 [Paramecium bursaria]